MFASGYENLVIDLREWNVIFGLIPPSAGLMAKITFHSRKLSNGFTFNMLKIDKKRTRLALNLVLLALFLFFNAIFFVWAKMSTIHLGYKLTEKHKEEKEAKRETQKLKITLANLRSNERIQFIGYSKFNLVYPGKDRIVVIRAPKK